MLHRAYATVNNRLVPVRDLADLPVTANTDEPIPASSVTPSWRSLADPKFAADLAGVDYNGMRKADYGGTALGIIGTGQSSDYGIVSDVHGNTYFLFTRPSEKWEIFWQFQLMGPQFYFYIFDGFTGGDFNRNQELWQGKTNANVRYDRPIEGIDVGEVHEGRVQYRATNPYELIKTIEAAGRKLDRPVIILNERDVVTVGSILEKALPIVLAIVKPLAATFLGIPAQAFDIVSSAVISLAKDGKVSLDTLVQAAMLIAPEGVRKYIGQAQLLYADVKNKNYLGAAEKLGLPVTEYHKYFSNILAGDFSTLLANSKLHFTELFSTVQNIQNFDALSAIRGMALSGGLRDKIIEYGTTTKIPAMQNLLAASTAPTLLSTVPKIQEIVAQMLHSTDDITNVDEHKAFVQAALGSVFGADALETMTTTALTERAIQNAINHTIDGVPAPFVMPISIPVEARYRIADEVADNAGVVVFVDSPDESGRLIRETVNNLHRKEWY